LVVADLEYVRPRGCFKGDVPLSLAVRAGSLIFVSGIPAHDPSGHVAVNDFPAQMVQVMENITCILAAAGAAWDCVTKVNVLLTRRDDFADMNRIYARYFPNGRFPARTTAVVGALPDPEFLLEIECQAVIGGHNPDL
jgi:enamine deaminase RidA (YjgF/YER057c/UK114 family)